MKKEEQTVQPKIKAIAKSKNQTPLSNKNEAEQRAAEMPGKQASVAAELKNRTK